MQIQTFSIVTGSGACNARCPFCVSRMTGAAPVKPQTPNWRNFEIACQLAVRAGATTAMLTGKGEPTLWPGLVTEYLERLRQHPIPIVELQTNGLDIARGRIPRETLQRWYELNLSTVAISVVGQEPKKNLQIYTPEQAYPDLVGLIGLLHDVGFTVRLICVMLKGHVDGPEKVSDMIEFARAHEVEQLTFLPVARPDETRDPAASAWTGEHQLGRSELLAIHKWIEFSGMHIQDLPHGARVYDVGGQNVCLNHCLDPQPTSLELMRNLIYFPDGRLRHRWDADGAVIL
jgi:MoaA/NifB/PqqE/SkfB family radical SAM enzyme